MEARDEVRSVSECVATIITEITKVFIQSTDEKFDLYEDYLWKTASSTYEAMPFYAKSQQNIFLEYFDAAADVLGSLTTVL